MMAATNSSYSFALSYGLAGGPIHSRGLRKQMTQAGFTPADMREADIIVAHSAGCWLLPEDSTAQLIMYVGMPLANAKPRETWRKAVGSGFKNNSRKRSLKIAAKNMFYSLTQPLRNLRIITSASKAAPVILSNVPSIFIANHYDPWPQAPTLDEYLKTQDWSFISLDGSHDDIWDHPGRYVEIIEHYANLLA